MPVTIDSSGGRSGSGPALEFYDLMLPGLGIPDGAPGLTGKLQLSDLANHIETAYPGLGDVFGPDEAIVGNLAVFASEDGKEIADSGTSPSAILIAATAAAYAHDDVPQGDVSVSFASSGNADGTAFTVPASPSGAGRFVLSRVVVRLSTALTGSGSVAVTVGATAGGQEFVTSQTVNSSSSVGVIAGLNISTLGASMLATQGYEAVLAAGATVVVRCATTGTVSAGAIKV